MKMTRLEWRYLQKIALDHPYFDTHELPLTEKEAEAIVKANIHLTGREFVDSIYAKLGMTRPSEEKKLFAWLRSIGDQFTIPPIRKIVISVLVVLLLTVFFAATPMGQAIAESVIQYIVTLFDDGSIIISQPDSETSILLMDSEDNTVGYEQQEGLSNLVYVNSFNDFTRVTGKTPFKLQMPYKELYYIYDSDIDYLELHATYAMMDGIIITYQIWDVENSFSTTLTGYSAYDQNGSVYYSIEKNGDIYCKRIIEDSYVVMASKGSFSLDDLIAMLIDE